MTNLSMSSQIIEYMKPMAEGSTFTSKEIASAMKLDDDGPVTGLMSRLKNAGYIRESGRNGRAFIYELIRSLESFSVRKAPSVGGTAGRHTTGVSRKQRLINSLLSLTAEIEQMKGDLSDFSTHDILKELEKRTKQPTS